MWKAAALAVVLAAYAVWFWAIWMHRTDRWARLVAPLAITLGPALMSLITLVLGERSIRSEISGGTAEALVMTPASRFKLIVSKLCGSLEFLIVAAALLPMYCLAACSGGFQDGGAAFIDGGYSRWLLLVHGWPEGTESVIQIVTVGLSAFVSDVTWYVFFAACGICTATSRRSGAVVWIKAFFTSLLLLAMFLLVARLGTDRGMTPFDWSLADGLTGRIPSYFVELPSEPVPGWSLVLLSAGNTTLRLLLAWTMLLHAAQRFDLIAVDHDLPSRWRFLLRKKVLVPACGSALAIVVASGFWLRHVGMEHERLLREAKANLLALNFEPPPEGENAAPLYRKAFKLFVTDPFEFCNMKVKLQDTFEIDIGAPEVATLLQNESAALAELEQAAAKPSCVFVSDYSAGAYAVRTSPSSIDCRSTWILLVISALRAAHDGDYPKAAQRIKQMLHLARGIGQSGLSLDYMTMMALEGDAYTIVRDILTQMNPDEATLRQMLATLDEHCRSAPSWREMLRVEHTIGSYHAAEIAASWTGHGLPLSLRGKLTFILRRSAGVVLDDAATYDSLWVQVDDALDAPLRDAYFRIERLVTNSAFKETERSLGYPYGIFLLFPRNWRSRAESTAMLKCARLATACRLHEVRTGRLPESLDELAEYFPADFAEVRSDPFSSGRLLYKRTEGGFIVYSVGPYDPRDNGAPKPYESYGDPDLVFAVDRKLWEEYRAERTELFLSFRRPKSALPRRRPSRSPPKKSAPSLWD